MIYFDSFFNKKISFSQFFITNYVRVNFYCLRHLVSSGLVDRQFFFNCRYRKLGHKFGFSCFYVPIPQFFIHTNLIYYELFIITQKKSFQCQFCIDRTVPLFWIHIWILGWIELSGELSLGFYKIGGSDDHWCFGPNKQKFNSKNSI
jgi:hypothetical protein